jgi:hypothetical protein
VEPEELTGQVGNGRRRVFGGNWWVYFGSHICARHLGKQFHL